MFRLTGKLLTAFFALLTVLFSAGVGTAAEGRAKYIFLFIGDGMSIPQRNAAELFLTSQNSPRDLELALLRAGNKFPGGNGVTDFKPSIQRMLMTTFPGQGFSSTYSYNSLITDSASAGTAIATGNKTQDGVLAMDPSATEKYVSMAKLARNKGMKVGVISTVSIDHATPAAFYASSPSRDFHYEIALQIPESGFNFFGGGGFVQPRGSRRDQKDIANVLKDAGYRMHATRADFDRIKTGDDKIVAINPVLDGNAAMPYAIDRGGGEITLAEFVAKGIEVLNNPNGFFIMAEGGKIDWACHANDAATTVREVLDLDDAVKVAYEFYKAHPKETLIIVTGDHETGGMSVGFANTNYDVFLSRLKKQKGSFLKFNSEFAAFRSANPNAKLEDALPLVESFFGLKLYDSATMADLEAKAKAGDTAAYEALGMALRDYEMKDLTAAFAMSMMNRRERPTATYEYHLSYGSYEPMTVTLTRILNRKAGIGWTTYSHTALPTPVSAIGPGHELFNGYYDNTDVFKKIVDIGALNP